jgi:ATP-dependent helicase STH1/SNF2
MTTQSMPVTSISQPSISSVNNQSPAPQHQYNTFKPQAQPQTLEYNNSSQAKRANTQVGQLTTYAAEQHITHSQPPTPISHPQSSTPGSIDTTHSNALNASPFPDSPSSTTSVRRSTITTQSVSMSRLDLLGIKGMIDPQNLLPSTEKFSIHDPVPFIPSLMPKALDVKKMKAERERDISDRILMRVKDLYTSFDGSHDIDLPQSLDTLNESEIDRLVEFKALTLINKQKALRGDIVSDFFFFNTVAMNESNQVHFTRMKRPTLLEANITEQFDLQQRSERSKRENQKRQQFIESVCKQSRAVHSHIIIRNDKRTKFGKGIVSMHSIIEKEEQKRMERTAKQRLQALKANDEEAYIKLLDQTKDTRITHLLKQTNSFLDSLAQAVKTQQKATQSIKTDNSAYVKSVDDEENDNSDDQNEKVDYYAVAHRIKEVITKQPSILVGGTLKEYQLKGLQWMVSLYNNKLNGILADEMGLGKTIQSLSLITYLIEVKRIPGPFLVLVPLSTLTNWTLEFQRWAPSVKTVVYKGPPNVRKPLQHIVKSGDFQVLLTTYEYVIRDKAVLSRIKWEHMIIDEGHRMKNTQSKLSATLTQFYVTKYRLILTGTPLQNNLPELWALLNFVLPKIFNSVKSFDEWFNTPFENTGGQDKMDLSEEETLLVIRRLHKVLRPFLLRRLKKDVEKDLPDKVERVIKCKMSALQSSLYQQVLKYKKLVGGSGSTKGLNNKLMQLRKVCNHPFVFEEVENLIDPSHSSSDLLWRTAGKFELLDRIIPKFQKTGHRILIFFQMTQIMDIMEDFLRFRDIRYLRLDGSTKADERTELLQKFNAPNSPYFAFLLSTRAGGLGLNLQTADTVIIYDTDWNPHQDLQAQDRAHRIGQTKEVRILRLITEGSVEENILARAHQKLEIDGKVIQAGKFDNKSTPEEQEAFLRLLLEQEEKRRSNKKEEDEELDDDELNEILARTDEERVIFAEIDRKRNLTCDYGKGRQFDRLFGEHELPEEYQEEYLKQAIEPEPVVENYGRGARERKITHYDDGLTEEQWLEAIENDYDSPEAVFARERMGRRRDSEELGEVKDLLSPAEALTPNASAPVSGVKRKRGRRGVSESGTPMDSPAPSRVGTPVSVSANSRRKVKGRTSKVKETLTPLKRAKLTENLNTLFELMEEAIDDEDPEDPDRKRVEIFLELPDKKQYPDYYKKIKSPIACEIIENRIKTNQYQSIDEFRADVKLMFDNARKYNVAGSLVVEDANVLETLVEEKVLEIIAQEAAEIKHEPTDSATIFDAKIEETISETKNSGVNEIGSASKLAEPETESSATTEFESSEIKLPVKETRKRKRATPLKKKEEDNEETKKIDPNSRSSPATRGSSATRSTRASPANRSSPLTRSGLATRSSPSVMDKSKASDLKNGTVTGNNDKPSVRSSPALTKLKATKVTKSKGNGHTSRINSVEQNKEEEDMITTVASNEEKQTPAKTRGKDKNKTKDDSKIKSRSRAKDDDKSKDKVKLKDGKLKDNDKNKAHSKLRSREDGKVEMSLIEKAFVTDYDNDNDNDDEEKVPARKRKRTMTSSDNNNKVKTPEASKSAIKKKRTVTTKRKGKAQPALTQAEQQQGMLDSKDVQTEQTLELKNTSTTASPLESNKLDSEPLEFGTHADI